MDRAKQKGHPSCGWPAIARCASFPSLALPRSGRGVVPPTGTSQPGKPKLPQSLCLARRQYIRSPKALPPLCKSDGLCDPHPSRSIRKRFKAPGRSDTRELVSSAPQISRALAASRVRPTALQSLGANWESDESQTQASLFPKPSTASSRQLHRRRGIRPPRRTQGRAAPAHEAWSPVCGLRSRRWDGPALLRRH